MKTIILDFDGTIADSFEVVISILHALVKRTNPVSPEEIAALRQMRLIDIAQTEKIPRWRVPFLLIRGRRMLATRLDEVTLFNGMEDVISRLAASGHPLYLMSSNSGSNVKYFLTRHHLKRYFKNIYGGVGLYGKARALRRIMRQNHLAPADCIYVGDEPRDIQGAHEAGMACVAVSWGYTAKELLLAHQPQAVASNPKDLLRTIKRLDDRPL